MVRFCNAYAFITFYLCMQQVPVLGFHIPATYNNKKCGSQHRQKGTNVKILTTQYFPISITQNSNNENDLDDVANREEGEAVIITSKPKKYNQQLGEFEKLNVMTSSDTDSDDCPSSSSRTSSRIVRLYDFSDNDPIHFQTMWDIQKELVDGHVQRLKVEFQKKVPDTQFWSMEDVTGNYEGQKNSNEEFDFIPLSERNVGRDVIIFLSHEPVYTLGTASDENYIKSLDDGIDVVRIERGGEVTYHGPGQLTVYPIIDLRSYNQDIHWYMRALEEAILLSLKSIGINDAVREDDVTGVWVKGKKIAALGVKVKRWCTMHGLAVNVDERSLGNFNGIVPCGLEGRDVCCINDFLDTPITLKDFAQHLKEALEDVFEVKII